MARWFKGCVSFHSRFKSNKSFGRQVSPWDLRNTAVCWYRYGTVPTLVYYRYRTYLLFRYVPASALTQSGERKDTPSDDLTPDYM